MSQPNAKPTLLHEAVLQPITDEYPRNSEAAIVQLENDTMLLAWSHFVGGSTDWTSAQISARLSEDRGRTWGKPYVLQKNIGTMCTYSPSLLELQSGSLGFAFFVKNSKGDNRAYWRSSNDGGNSWSDPVAITPEVAYHILNNDRIVQLTNGRIVAPISYTPKYVDNKTPIRSFCAYSDDDGRTWRRGSGEIGLP